MVPLIDIPAVPTELEKTTVDMVEDDDDQWAGGIWIDGWDLSSVMYSCLVTLRWTLAGRTVHTTSSMTDNDIGLPELAAYLYVYSVSHVCSGRRGYRRYTTLIA